MCVCVCVKKLLCNVCPPQENGFSTKNGQRKTVSVFHVDFLKFPHICASHTLASGSFRLVDRNGTETLHYLFQSFVRQLPWNVSQVKSSKMMRMDTLDRRLDLNVKSGPNRKCHIPMSVDTPAPSFQTSICLRAEGEEMKIFGFGALGEQ